VSFGDYVSISNVGRLKELADELVWKHNVVFVSSAGNEGPALSTVGAPGGAYSSIIGVGAYVSSNMKDAMHSLMSDISNEEEATDHDNNAESEGVSGTNYTWSSRGPTFDGDWGVDITAPGGAITSVSNWTLQKSQLMCGTSMSSPHATGCVALLISACKAEGIPITPARIRKALLNTADFRLNMTAPDQGQGLLQVDKAFAYLQQTKDVAAEDIFFQATVQNRTGNTRGIYLRQSHETGVKQMCEIFINPQFRLEDVPSEATQRQKIDFEMSIRLVTDKGWVKVPSNMFLMNNGRSFTVDVDPTELSPGLHTAKIWGYDTSSPSSHAIFSLPVTITKPLPQQRTLSFSKLELQSAEIKRFFVTPPFGSTWMDISIHDSRSPTDESSGVAVHLHTVQVIRHASHRDYSKHRRLSMRPGQTIVTSIAVEENVTAEIVLASGWSNATAHWLDASVEFRGVRPTPRSVHMTADSGGALVRITSDLKDESVNPEAKLTHWLTPLRPSADIVLRPLGLRDTFHDLDTKIFELILTYEFEQETKGPVTPRAGLLQDFLYDSAFESQLMLFFDKDKKLVGSSDAYPRSVTLPKGDITLRLQIRHNDPKVLENLKTMCLSMERKLEKPVAVSAYSSKTAFSSGESALKLSTLKQGNTAPVYFANPTTIPSTCKLGDVLRGTVTYASGDKSLSGEGKRPGGFPISFVVGPKEAKAASDTETPEPKDERSAQEKLADDIRKVKISCLEKMPELDDFTELFQQLETDYPRHIPLLVARLKFLDAHKSRGDLLETIVDAAESVIALISEIELAQHFGRAIDKEDHETVKLNKDLAEKKDFLVDALARQALAYADMTAPDAAEKFQEALRHLKSWIDIESSEKYAALYMEQESRAGRHGNVLKTLGKLLEKDVKDTLRPMNRLELLEKRVALLEQVGFDALAEYDKRSQMLAAPKSYCLF
jgi:tripeptidyl-peptidase-2